MSNKDRTKEAAAKILLKRGWTLDEVNAVLGYLQPIPAHYAIQPITGYVQAFTLDTASSSSTDISDSENVTLTWPFTGNK